MASFLFASFLILSLIPASSAYDFYVGGRVDGWVQNPKESYNSWAERMRFQVNDKLVFKYKSGDDSVLVVNKEDYDACNVTNPIEVHKGGNSVFSFSRSGPFFFISGVPDRCMNGEKLIVVVMAQRHKKPLPPAPASPSPSPSPSAAVPTASPSPAPAPASTVAPPTTSPSPAPAPASTVVPPTTSPSPAPSTTEVPAPVEGPGSSGGSSGNEASPPLSAPPPMSSSSSYALTASRVTIGMVVMIMAHAFLI